MDSSSWLHKVLLSDISRNGDGEARPCSQVGERREVLVPGSAPGTPRILPARILWDLLGMSSHREKQHGDSGKQGRSRVSPWTSPGHLTSLAAWVLPVDNLGFWGFQGWGRSGMSWDDGSQEDWDVLIGARRNKISWEDGRQEGRDVLGLWEPREEGFPGMMGTRRSRISWVDGSQEYQDILG